MSDTLTFGLHLYFEFHTNFKVMLCASMDFGGLTHNAGNFGGLTHNGGTILWEVGTNRIAMAVDHKTAHQIILDQASNSLVNIHGKIEPPTEGSLSSTKVTLGVIGVFAVAAIIVKILNGS